MSTLRAHLDAHGWARQPGAVAGDALPELRRAFDAALPSGDPASVRQRPGGCRSEPALWRWVAGGALGALGRAALGCPAVRLLQEVLLTKPAGAGGTVPWHRDAWYTGYLDPPGVVSIRLALDLEDERSGALEVLAGSHRWPEVFEGDGTVAALPRRARRLLPPTLAATAPTLLRLAPGGASVHRADTWHASGPNRAAYARRTVVVHLFDARLRVRSERLPAGVRDRFPCAADGTLDPSVFPEL